MKVKQWIEAMRLRTLPVSIAGVVMGSACAAFRHSFSILPALLCLMFALLAQIASNFANEYYDFKNGLDRKGREGFRRGVTEGDISPSAMKKATYGVLVAAAVTGLILMICYGHLWMLPIGIVIALFAMAYSTGPYPLSHHGLGDIAVIIFFGFVPVTLTAYLQTDTDFWQYQTLLASLAVGLMSANVLIVNNYRDMEDDAAVNKKTTCVIFGRRVMGGVYLIFGIIAAISLVVSSWSLPRYTLAAPVLYTLLHLAIWSKLIRLRGAALNPLLGRTAVNLLLCALLYLIFGFISG